MQEFECGQYRLQYEINQNEIAIVGYSGMIAELLIPETIEGVAVTSVAKKAFMGNRVLKTVSFPRTIRLLEDWAFAHCDMLKEMNLYPNEIMLGKGVFLNSDKLAKANLLERPEGSDLTEDEMNQLSGLLASTINVLEAPFLFTPERIGNDEWLTQYEARVASFLSKDDMEDYAKTVSCGEEDYESTNLENFLSDKRKAKVRMIFVRLLHAYKLAEADKEAYMTYLKEHMPPGQMCETWQVVSGEHGDEEEYFDVLADAGCITNDNVHALIADLGQTRAQMRAYLLRFQQTNLEATDFFDSFAL